MTLLQSIKRHIKIMTCYFSLNLSSALEYRASFFVQAFGMALSNSSFIFFWWIAFNQIGGLIAGYSFKNVLFIWAAASSSFGLAHVLFPNANSLTNLIITGELDTYLLQPCNILVNIICARTSLSAYGDLAYGFILMALTYGLNLSAWVWFLVAIFIGTLLMTAVAITAHTLTFYLGNASMIGGMSIEFIINFSIYPEKIYGNIIRAVMYSIIPAAFIVHVPLKLLSSFSPMWLVLLIAVTITYCVLSVLFFYSGLKKYESGNVIITRQ